jgi:hypothetical protein
VEGFYVHLLFLDEDKREKARGLYGIVAKRMGKKSKLTRTRYRVNGSISALKRTLHLSRTQIRTKLEAHPDVAREFVMTRPREIVLDCGHRRPHS